MHNREETRTGFFHLPKRLLNDRDWGPGAVHLLYLVTLDVLFARIYADVSSHDGSFRAVLRVSSIFRAC